MIAAATSSEPATMTGPMAFGRMCRTICRDVGRAQAARRLDELLLAQREELGPHQARHRHPAKTADDADDQDEDAELRAHDLLHRVAEQVNDQQQERELREGEEEVGQPHQRVVHAAADLPGDGPDGVPTQIAISIAPSPTASEIRPP